MSSRGTFQSPLLFPPEPPANRARTSIAAAQDAKAKAPKDRDRILDRLRSMNVIGATQAQLAQVLGIPLSTVCARVNELGQLGLVRCLSETRKTRGHSSGFVFVLSEFAGSRPVEDWPKPRTDWRQRALAAEARVRELETALGMRRAG